MKRFEISMVVTSLVGLFCLSALDAPPAYADFTFGEPAGVKRIIPALDGWNDQIITSCTLDGHEMYVQEAPGRSGGQGGFDLWVIKRNSVDAAWGSLENLGPSVNSSGLDAGPSISADGLTLYFYSRRSGGYGSDDLYMTTRATRNAPWGPPVNLGPKVNTPQGDTHPRLAPDNLELYFVSNRPGGYGGYDIYVCRRATSSDPWGDPANLGPVVNSAYHESAPALSPDGLLLTFADFPGSVRPGGYGGADLWMARRATISSPWQAPVNIGPAVNGQEHDWYPLISPDGSTLYLWSNRIPDQYVYQTPILPIVDFTGDGKVDGADLVLLLANMGKKNSVCDIGPYPWGDGVVDDKDQKVFMDYSMSPGPRASDVARDVVLSWVSLALPKGYDVYLGTSPEAVRTASRTNPQGVLVSQGQSTTSYAPAQPLGLGTTYYWRIDEVNPVTRPGEVWSFTTLDYPDYVVEDFESYGASGGKDLFNTWVDGYVNNFQTNGAMVGLPGPVNGTFCESTIVHSGKQSLPLTYDNSKAALSEVVRRFDHAQDWTAGGIKTLSLWFQGVAGNTGQLYLKINSTKVPYDGAASNLAKPAWTVWTIDLSKPTGLNKVTALTIGIEGAGAKGTLYFDDICLYPMTPVAPSAAGLQAQYQFEGNANDSSGQGRDGVLQGSAMFAAGKFGPALSLDGVAATVNVTGYKGILADAKGVQHAFAVCAWIKTAANGDILAWGANAGGQRLNFRVDTVLRVEHGSGNMRGTNGPSLVDDQWHHVALRVPEGAALMEARLYVDGRDVSAPANTRTAFNLKAGVDVAIGAGGTQTGRFFKGLVDEVRIYDRELSLAEIMSLAGQTTPVAQP